MSRIGLLSLQLLVAVVVLGLWQFFATVPVFGRMLLPPFFFSNPVDVGSQIVAWFTSGVIWKHLIITLWESILAFVIGSFGGVMVGFWFARQPRVAAVFDPYVKMVNALPRVVLAPIFTLWLGLGIWSKVALGVTLVFFIVFFNVYQGVKEVSTTVLDNGRMLGMNERQLMRHVYWPSALSWMFSSLHTSIGFAVVGAVVGEYMGSAAGLGYLIQQAEGVFDVAGVFAGMFVLSAFVILIDMGVTRGRAAAPGLAAGGCGEPGVEIELSSCPGRVADAERSRLAPAERLAYESRNSAPEVLAALQCDLPRNDGAKGAPSIQQLRIIRRLRRRLDRDRLDGAAVGLGAAMWRALRNDDEIAGLHLHFLVAEPDRALAFEDVLNLVGIGVQMLGRAAVLDRDGRAVHRNECLVAHAAGVDGRQRVTLQLPGVNDLSRDDIGGQRRAQQMGDAAAGGKGRGDRQGDGGAIHG